LDKHAIDVDTAETLAGVVRLLRTGSSTGLGGHRSRRGWIENLRQADGNVRNKPANASHDAVHPPKQLGLERIARLLASLVRVRVDQPADQHFAHGPRIGGASSQTRRCPRTGRKRCQRASTIASATSADPSVCSVQAPLTDRSVNACQPPIALGAATEGCWFELGPGGDVALLYEERVSSALVTVDVRLLGGNMRPDRTATRWHRRGQPGGRIHWRARGLLLELS
jgi:hypothetical protein